MQQKNDLQRAIIKYDRINDVLNISFGPQRPSYCAAEIDDIFIMKFIDNDEYSGLKILDFSERINDGSLYELNLPFAFDFKQVERELKLSHE